MALTDKLTAIANAIRAKTGKAASMTLAEMPTEIGSIETGITPSGSINITQNGTYDVTEKASAVVSVSGQAPTLITKSISANGTYNALSDSADGYSQVTVNVPTGGGASLLDRTVNFNVGNEKLLIMSAVSGQALSAPYPLTPNGDLVLVWRDGSSNVISFPYTPQSATTELYGTAGTNILTSATEQNGTPYNGGLGYKTGYRFRSSGAEATYSNANQTGYLSGYYRVNAGDVVYIKGLFLDGTNSSHVDSSAALR